MSEKCLQADAYVAKMAPSVNPQYRPHFHAAPPVGWINDPNGFCVYQGRYHLFAQYYPYDSVWGPMHWGHWVSDDLVSWEWVSVALAPDSPWDDCGCFSGTALQVDDRLVIIYTGVHKNERGVIVQEQCIAESRDGVHFEKWACNPVISERDLPDGTAIDFRDPKLERTADGFRVIVAHRGENGGRQLTFTSPDLHNWTYAGVLLEGIGEMPECPDYSTCCGQKLMLTCVIGVPREGLRFRDVKQDVLYLVGEEQDGKLNVKRMESVDFGTHFYAPESIVTPDGRNVMIGWLDTWLPDSPTHYLGHGWRGEYSIARELTLREGRLYQQPVRELQKLRGEAFEAQNVAVQGTCVLPALEGRRFEMETELSVSAGQTAEIRLLQDGDEYFSVHYDADSAVLTADHSRCGYTAVKDGAPEENAVGRALVWNASDTLRLQIFVDQNAVEIFVNDGAVALSSLAFPRGEAKGISFAGNFVIRTLKKWTIMDA